MTGKDLTDLLHDAVGEPPRAIVAETVLRRARQRHFARTSAVVSSAALAVAAVVLPSLLTGGPAAGPDARGGAASGNPSQSNTFVAEYRYGSGDTGGGRGTFLSLFDAQSGKHLRDLQHFAEGGQVRLAGFSRTAGGSVIYATARGPYYRSNVSGGDPRPGSCGGTVYQLDARTGRTKTLFSVGKDWTVGSPVMSPNGRSIAYLSQACTAMFDARVVVRDLAAGTERQVWAPRTSATTVRWRSDGRQLVFAVMYPSQRTGSDEPGYVVVPASADGAQPSSAVRRAPDRGCVVENALYSSSGIQIVEGCPNIVTPPARLVQLVGDGPAVAWRASTALCPNGMTAAYDPQGRLLVTSTTSCGGAHAPVDVVQMWNGKHSREVARYTNPQQFVSAAT